MAELARSHPRRSSHQDPAGVLKRECFERARIHVDDPVVRDAAGGVQVPGATCDMAIVIEYTASLGWAGLARWNLVQEAMARAPAYGSLLHISVRDSSQTADAAVALRAAEQFRIITWEDSGIGRLAVAAVLRCWHLYNMSCAGADSI